MADSQGRHKGNDVLMYVGTSEPTAANDPTDANYTLVGLLISNNFNGEGNILTAADKETSDFTSSLVGNRSYTLDVEAHHKNDVDAGHTIIRDAWKNGTSLYWLIGSDTAGDEAVSGQAVVSSYANAHPTDDFSTVSATLNGQGAPAFGTIAT